MALEDRIDALMKAVADNTKEMTAYRVAAEANTTALDRLREMLLSGATVPPTMLSPVEPVNTAPPAPEPPKRRGRPTKGEGPKEDVAPVPAPVEPAWVTDDTPAPEEEYDPREDEAPEPASEPASAEPEPTPQPTVTFEDMKVALTKVAQAKHLGIAEAKRLVREVGNATLAAEIKEDRWPSVHAAALALLEDDI